MDAVREELRRRLVGEGFETVFTSEGFTNLLHPDPELGRLDLVWVKGETSRRLHESSTARPLSGGPLVPVPAFSISGSVFVAEPLPDDSFRASPEVSEALERDRPGPMTLAECADFVRQFHWTAEPPRAIPSAEGLPRFTLDDRGAVVSEAAGKAGW